MKIKSLIYLCACLVAAQPAHAIEWKKFKKPLLGLGAAAISACIAYQGIKRGNGELRSNAATLGNLCGAFWALGSAMVVACQEEDEDDMYSTYKYSAGANVAAILAGFYIFTKLNPDVPITDAFRKK